MCGMSKGVLGLQHSTRCFFGKCGIRPQFAKIQDGRHLQFAYYNSARNYHRVSCNISISMFSWSGNAFIITVL